MSGNFGRRALLGVALAFAALLAIAAPASSAEPRLALEGYDPVAYFTSGAPMQGKAEFAFDYDETRYWFATAENKAAFAANPDKFAPRYNGYCAMSITKGLKLTADPHHWTIVDGHLFVFAAQIDPVKLADKSWIAAGISQWDKVKAEH
jgi:YHS domain-containing protein